MNLIRLAIDRPIAVVAAVLLVMLFGYVALQTIPIQLTPDVQRPLITVTTDWRGAAPAEIEREITNKQEEVLRGLEGLEEMTSSSTDGQASVTLEFATETNMDRALLLVSNRLDRVNGYPDEADEPSLRTAGAEDQAIAWFTIRRAEGNTRPIHTYGDFVEDTVQDRLERVAGVARVNVYGGSAGEMQIIIDPSAMARYGMTVGEVVGKLQAANVSLSAGKIEEGKRQYVVRTEGEFETPDQVGEVVLRTEMDNNTGHVSRVLVRDVAAVQFSFKEASSHIRYLGENAIAVNTVRETGANVIETMEGIREAIKELNEGPLAREDLYIKQVYDETVYIDSAIDLVQQNIWVGGLLAAIVLLVFLRSFGATMVISLAIPVSVIGSFVAMAALGRSLNVISLAGIAFAVGMVVDAAIVVLENIFRLRQRGRGRKESAYRGASQVWGAVLVSALTTVMVFIPILIMDLEVGQLFRDIAVAISVAVMLSLVVSVTVIPALCIRFLPDDIADEEKRVHIGFLDNFARGFVEAAVKFTDVVTRSMANAILTVVIIVGLALTASWVFLPKLEYLPEGNRNFVFGIIMPPPGYNLETTKGIAAKVENAVRQYWASETGPESEEGQPPKMDNFFFVATKTRAFVGGSAVDGQRAAELIPVIRNPVFSEPGTFGFVTQPSLFGRSIGGGRAVDLNISGPELEDSLTVALQAMGLLNAILPQSQGTQYRPQPGLELGAPEIRVLPNRQALADNGLSARDLGMSVDAFNDGLRVAEITVGGKRMDLTLLGPEGRVPNTQGIDFLPVVNAQGQIVSVSQLAKILVTAGPTEIRHLERERTVTLQIRPASNIALESAMEMIQSDVIAKLEAQGLPEGVKLRLSGTADKLTQTWDAMVWQLAIAMVIVYLVMAVLFESFLYPLIIMLSVPLATAGAVAGLALVNIYHFQPLDMLTVLGFVILVGIVVNNAILLVHQTLHHVRVDGMTPSDSIRAATRDRIRPIFMSTLTSVFGMLPLVLFPGAGSELYRGLGSVVVGGLALSAVLTLLIVPPLMAVVVKPMEERRLRLARIAASEEA